MDLERQEVVDVLHDRSAKTTAVWLEKHPTIEIVSRDRCGLYARGARQGAAQARQVADRFHLVQNLRQAIEQQLSRDHRPTQKVQGKTAPQAAHETPRADEVLQHQQMVRQGRRGVWLDRFDQVKALQRAGRNLSSIVEQTGLNWRTVAKWLEVDALPERRPRDPKSTNPVKFESLLAQRWNEGIRTGRRLLMEIRQQGYTGSVSHLQRLLSRWRRTGSAVLVERPPVNDTSLWPTPRIVPPIAASILCIKPRGQLSRQEVMKVNLLKETSPSFAVMRQLAMRFRGILRGSDPSKLAGWMDDAHRTGLYTVASGVSCFSCAGTLRPCAMPSVRDGATDRRKVKSTASKP